MLNDAQISAIAAAFAATLITQDDGQRVNELVAGIDGSEALTIWQQTALQLAGTVRKYAPHVCMPQLVDDTLLFASLELSQPTQP